MTVREDNIRQKQTLLLINTKINSLPQRFYGVSVLFTRPRVVMETPLPVTSVAALCLVDFCASVRL